MISKNIKQLLKEQLGEWTLARDNYKALEDVESKDFFFDGFTIRVQFNPARIQSSSAKVDAKSIQKRECFICRDNLPVEQKGIPFGKRYQILVNPYPIFPEHFTITDIAHTDQLIAGRYGDMLDMAESLTDYIIFYNGPKCGASAPDHAHFQAGIKGFLPIENDIRKIDKNKIVAEDSLTVYTLKNYLRNGFLIEAKDKSKSIDFFNKLYSLLELKDGDREPMMNILSWYDSGTWYTVVFPREKHRPDCFYAEGEDNLLISPASVDLGGVLIIPVEKDFRKITRENIIHILKEVSISDEKMPAIVDCIKE